MTKKMSKYIALATIAILSSGVALNVMNTVVSADEAIIGDVSVPPTFKLFSSENGDKTYYVRDEVGVDNLPISIGKNYKLTFKNDGIFEINDTTYEVKDGLISGNTELNIIFNLNDKVVIKQADTNLEITFLAIKDTEINEETAESSTETSNSTEGTIASSTTDSTNESTENSTTESSNETTETTESSEQEENKAILVGNTITLADSYLNYYSVYYDAEKDELSFTASDLSNIFGIEPPKALENINLGGKKTFSVNGENWELVDNESGTYNLKYLDNRVIRFSGLEEYSNLINTYSLFAKNSEGKVDRITDSNLNFDVEYIDLNSAEGQGYNNNQAPIINFKYDETSFNFDLILDEANKLAGQNFVYTYDLTEEFVNSDVYKELENVKQHSGYIKRNVLSSGGYQAYVMEYVLTDGKLEIKVLNTALSEPTKTAKPTESFNGDGKIELETIIEEETTEISIPKPLKRPINEKTEEANITKPIEKKGEVLPKMGIGPKFAGIPLLGVGIGSLSIALSILLRRKFPISTNIDDDKNTEE